MGGTMQPTLIRRIVDLTGVVQGIGFRPALFRLATAAGLGGWVQNRPDAVRLALEGRAEAVESFLQVLPDRLTPPARVATMTTVGEECLNGAITPFAILASDGDDEAEVLIPADLAMCPDCRADVLDPANRRYGYAFTTCSLCGPRYTVVTGMPYDRQRTTMAGFPLCAACQREYDNPADRRFHAQSIACPHCGPALTLASTQGQPLQGNALHLARQELRAGRIVGVRGLGGFLLAADAFNPSTLQRLRERKHRPHKPFAVMAPDMDAVGRYCVVTPEAVRLLTSHEAPIVILDVRPDVVVQGLLPINLLSPDTGTLGVMLPTSPLHLLLLAPLADDPVPPFDLLVMTSGNRRSEPICMANDEAAARLEGVADCLLLHDREIVLRNDDSVCAVHGDMIQVWRRARGYAPQPIHLGWSLNRRALGMGADMKNAVALGYASRVVLSPHIGDLDTPEAVAGFEQVVQALPGFLARQPEVVAVDLHPDMQATRFGRHLADAAGIPVTEVQHHQAHGAACLAEHGLREGLALVMDGMGWGPDGTVWGAELLNLHDDGSFERCATFAPARLPGGDVAIQRPVRQLVARWVEAGLPLAEPWLTRLGVTAEEASVWSQQCRQGVNAPSSHAAGRVFDAFAVLLGCAPDIRTYEGQPAVRLEILARRCRTTPAFELPLESREVDGVRWIDWSPAFRWMTERVVEATDTAAMAMAVHHAVAQAAQEMVASQLDRCTSRVIALSGGVFLNRILNALLVPRLEQMGLRVLCHRQTPPGDGCIALGQVAVAGGRAKAKGVESCVWRYP